MPDPNEPLIDEQSGIEERPQNRRDWSGALPSLVIPALIVAAIVGALLWVERSRDGGSGDDGRYGIVELPEGLNTTGRSPASDIGRAAPDFLLRKANGGELRLSDLRGRPVLVNFWASWCAPCREEMPEIVRAYREHHADGLEVVAVDLQENADIVRAFAADYGMDFHVVVDRTGQVATAWRIGGPIQGIPSSYFLDGEGVVRGRYFGPMAAEEIERQLEAILP